MNQTAYIDGYMTKQGFVMADPETGRLRFTDPITGEQGWEGAERFVSRANPAQAFRDAKKYYQWTQRPDVPKNFEGPHEKFFTGPEAKKHLKDTPYQFLTKKYTPQAMGVAERYAPPGVYKNVKAHAEKRLGAAAERGDYSEIAELYQTSPEARRMVQQKAWPEYQRKKQEKIQEYKKKFGKGLAIGGGGLLIGLLLSKLFSAKKQGADPRQIRQLQAQIRQAQAQRPMRLGLVDRGRR